MKDPLWRNKAIAAVIIAIAIIWIGGKVAETMVKPRPLAKNAYVVDTSAMGSASTSTAAAPQGPAPIEPLFAKADADAGQKSARVCSTCHSFNKGEPAKQGPTYGIIGLKHAHMEGFSYSDAMKALSDKTWTFDLLNEFLYSPRNAVPGTKMTFAGIKNDQDRANVIAWLRTFWTAQNRYHQRNKPSA